MKKLQLLSCLFLFSILNAQEFSNWPGFRGEGNSYTQAKNLPLRWSNEDNIYFFCKNGATIIAKAQRENFVEVASNTITIDSTYVYGVAVTDDNFILRTGKELICIRKKVK